MRATKFVMCRNHLELSHQYILQPHQPYYFGKVLLFDTPMEYVSWNAQFEGIAWAQVPNYKIVVAFESSLSGKAFVTYKFRSDMDKLMMNMAEFYYEHEIKPHPGRFKKYLY